MGPFRKQFQQVPAGHFQKNRLMTVDCRSKHTSVATSQINNKQAVTVLMSCRGGRGFLLSYMKLLDVPLGLVINSRALKLTEGISRLILPGANQE